ncbi:hypothetical protein ACJIZ3_009059 [Penstemon smallii]|uniref:Uncharacterized protein n=1 Tax=Penstemon smallii TaxID=265156 RepID=A0ABD3TCM6_9LAMI
MNLSGPLENKLQFLDLRGNQITGPLPNISRFSFLKELKLGTNQLNGEILQGSLKLPNLRVLDLSSNKITGQVPDLSFSSFLKELYLDRNLFNGSLTKSIGSLSKLEVFVLQLSHLGVMDLAYNDLSGRIPFGGQLQTFDESVYEGNIGLCGEPVKKICPGDEIRPDPKITNGLNDLEVEDDGFITEGFYISMGIGFATGFWGILGTILLNKSFRYAVFNFGSGVQDYVCLKVELGKTRLRRRVQNP